MGDLINFRRAKKAKAHAERKKEAAANRAKFGTPKKLRDLADARAEKAKRDLDDHEKDDG